jgi:ABC-2 type transport system permease protein
MLKSLIQWLGADYEQWRVLTGVALKLDLRNASFGQRGIGESDNRGWQIFARVWIYVLFGIIFGVMVGINKDVFFTGLILITYTMMIVAMLVMVDFGAVVITPDDYLIMGYQPVSSRTYFLSRLTNVLIYSTAIALAVGIIPVLVFFFTLGFNPMLGFAALLAILLGSVAATLALVIIYAGLLRALPADRLKSIVGYVQMVMSFLVFGGYVFFTGSMKFNALSVVSLDPSPWLFLLPPAWFAGYLSLAAGNFRLYEAAGAAFSIIALAFLLIKARGKLALDYSDRLSSAMNVRVESKKASNPRLRRSWFLKKDEPRAVALLVRNQFKHDQKFRLAVLSILPLSLVYLFIGLGKGDLVDPFLLRNILAGNSWFLYYAVLLFPIMLNANLSNSDSYQASWIFYATPADRGRLVLASKGFVFAYFEIPYLMILGVVFFYFWRNLWHVLVHAAMLALLSHIFLQITVLFHPALPFSMPLRKAQRSRNLIVIMVLASIAAFGLMPVLVLVYPHPVLLSAVMAGFAIFSWLLEVLLRKLVQSRTASMEYRE